MKISDERESNNRTQVFYDAESSIYSQRRYGGIVDTYVKYFFRKRLSILLQYIGEAVAGRDKASLLEVGCADGIVMRSIDDEFPERFREMVGIDIAPKMIDEARLKNKNEHISFFVRDNDSLGRYDFILEIGFLNASLFESEFSFVKDYLNEGGYFICSLAGRNSLHHIFKQNIKGYHSYAYYEEMLSENFEIIQSEPYGLFIPKLWAVPALARVVQPILESVFKRIAPGLFHEKIYLVKAK